MCHCPMSLSKLERMSNPEQNFTKETFLTLPKKKTKQRCTNKNPLFVKMTVTAMTELISF